MNPQQLHYEVSITRAMLFRTIAYQLAMSTWRVIFLLAVIVLWSFIFGVLYAFLFFLALVFVMLLVSGLEYRRLQRVTHQKVIIQEYHFDTEKLTVVVPQVSRLELYRKNAATFKLLRHVLYFRYNRRSICVFLPATDEAQAIEKLRTLGWRG